MSAKFQEFVALILLSVAIFIHSSKLARIGTRFIGVTALPPTTKASSSSNMLFSFPLSRARGVRGLEPGESTFSRSLSAMLTFRPGVLAAAAFSWLIWASGRPSCRVFAEPSLARRRSGGSCGFSLEPTLRRTSVATERGCPFAPV